MNKKPETKEELFAERARLIRINLEQKDRVAKRIFRVDKKIAKITGKNPSDAFFIVKKERTT